MMDLINSEIRAIQQEIKDVPIFPVKETTNRINYLNDEIQFLIELRDKAKYES